MATDGAVMPRAATSCGSRPVFRRLDGSHDIIRQGGNDQDFALAMLQAPVMRGSPCLRLPCLISLGIFAGFGVSSMIRH